MQPDKAAAPSRRAAERIERYFTVESANRSLVFVRKVVRDIVQRYDELMKLRARREELGLAGGSGSQLEEVRRRIESTAEQLKELHEELADVGCELKDWVAGLVDFPALHQGRKIWLCWKLGEERITHWHELHAGYAARQPVGPDF
jgi:hypothetical protein